MSSDYSRLLDATIQHLQGLKERGVRFVNVSPATLAALTPPGRAGSRRAQPQPCAGRAQGS